eukprot:gb/GECG01006873.1/.p1 GENE.gb/GECG01006873.1/~~gb/GECG01006873.1/.p1  ORF type:complete len:321 (+),score=68.34 gb/GECG01006873.1/:1-963(+)
MARNEEKTNAMLNKWLSMKQEHATGGPEQRRPYLASECNSLPDAEKFRRQIVGEIMRKVTEIQNAGLGEARIRDLNDEINKLFREKWHWERQIKALGGPDYTRMNAASKALDSDGKAIPGGGSYKYFGAAKDLPGVRELFQASSARAAKRTRGELYKAITPDYYGFRDEEDGVLVEAEAAAEKELRKQLEEDWKKERDQQKQHKAELHRQARERPNIKALGTNENAKSSGKTEIITLGGDHESESEEEEDNADSRSERIGSILEGTAASDANVRSHVRVPSQEEISKLLVQKKKQLLMQRYASSDLQKTQYESQSLLNQK